MSETILEAEERMLEAEERIAEREEQGRESKRLDLLLNMVNITQGGYYTRARLDEMLEEEA